MTKEVVVDLPDRWAETNIGCIATINPPGATSAADDDDIVTFLPMAAVEELSGRVDTSDQRPFAAVKKGFTRFRDGDLLVAKITPSMENGKVAVARGLSGGLGCGSTEFHVIRAENGVEPDYLRYYIVRSAFRQAAKRNMQGAVGQQRVPPDYIRNSRVPLAPTNEQKRIVSKINELFSSVEEGERALGRVLRLVERYRQSVLKAAVTGELTRAWREKHVGESESGEALLARIFETRRKIWGKSEQDKMTAKSLRPNDDGWKQKYKEPAQPDIAGLPALPDRWVWTSLPTLCAAGATSGISVKGSNTPPGVPALRLDAMTTSGFDYKAIRYIPISEETACRLRIAEGDFFISRANGSLRLVGRAVLANELTELVVFPDTMIRYRLLRAPDLRGWLSTVWPSPLLRAQIEKRAKTTAGIHKISQEDISTLAIPLPPLDEQAVICSLVEERLVQAEHALLETLSTQKLAAASKQAILKKAFVGQLVRQDPSDEPASMLIERIAAERSELTKHVGVKLARTKKVKS